MDWGPMCNAIDEYAGQIRRYTFDTAHPGGELDGGWTAPDPDVIISDGREAGSKT